MKNPFIKLTKLNKTCVFGALSILLTIAFFASNVFMQRQVAIEQANSTTRSLVRFLAMDVDRIFYGVEQLFVGIDDLLNIAPDSSELHDSQLHTILADLKRENFFLSTLLVLDSEGKIVNWSGDGKVPQVTDRDYVAVQLESDVDGIFIGKPIVSRDDNKEWIFGISKAVRDDQHKLQYMLVAIIKIDYFYQRYCKLELPAETVVTIVSSDGLMYLRTPGQEKFVGKRFPKVAAIINSVNSVVTISPVDNDQLLAAIERVGDRPMFAAVCFKHKVFLAHWHRYALIMVVSALAIVALLIFFIRQIRAAEQQKDVVHQLLELQAITDPLTELYNRRYALQQADLEIRKALRREDSPIVVVMMDIDYFKQVNDTYGHDVGDMVLKVVAGIMRQQCRASDMLCRYGGEEFFILLPDTAVTGALANVEKIRLAIQNYRFSTNGAEFSLTASFGISDWQGESDISAAINRADKALYQAKNDGRNCSRCDHVC